MMDTTLAIEQVMVRYNPERAHYLLYSYEELKRMDVDIEFINQLLKLFEDEGSFNAAEFNRFSLKTIVDYIRKTHKYYLSKKLLEIEQSIGMLLQDYDDQHPLLKVLHNFYSRYKNHLAEHILEEESVLLPHIIYLEEYKDRMHEKSRLSIPDGCSLKNFIDSHHDVEDDLNIARRAILEYNPPPTNGTPYRILLSQLQVFEKDLAVHALIEDQVLIPRALQLERELLQR